MLNIKSPTKLITLISFFIISFYLPNSFSASLGNTSNQSFSKAKKNLERKVYNEIPRKTIYCLADFDSKKWVTDANGFASTKHKKRQKKIEADILSQQKTLVVIFLHGEKAMHNVLRKIQVSLIKAENVPKKWINNIA